MNTLTLSLRVLANYYLEYFAKNATVEDSKKSQRQEKEELRGERLENIMNNNPATLFKKKQTPKQKFQRGKSQRTDGFKNKLQNTEDTCENC